MTDTGISLLLLPGKLLPQIILGCLHTLVVVLPENSWGKLLCYVPLAVFTASPNRKQCSEEHQHLCDVWIDLTKARNAFTLSALWKLKWIRLFWYSFSPFYSWWERFCVIGNPSSVELLVKDGVEQGCIFRSAELLFSVLQILTLACDVLRVICSALAKLFKSEFCETSQQQMYRVSLAAL